MTGAPALVLVLALQQSPAPRAVAVTFDDLPFVSATPLDSATRDAATTRLLAALARHRVPAIGFVTEGKLVDSAGAPVPGMRAILERWVSAGFELGNHSYAHRDLHTTPLAEYETGILRGEQVTRELLATRGMAPRYFRPPYLRTGRSLAVRDSLLAFLGAHGYRIAPVTIDNADYIFARGYDLARVRGDSAGAGRIAEAFLTYMDTVVGFYERQAQLILGRDLPQVLLLHASTLNGDTFDRLATRLEERGYRMIPLDEALTDSAYASPDRYTGPGGFTWLHRWALTRHMPAPTFAGEPRVPDWVVAAAGG
jgi:peptidoglycan/xylan/chitin deacetylase (PgdA/CDA1 family)